MINAEERLMADLRRMTKGLSSSPQISVQNDSSREARIQKILAEAESGRGQPASTKFIPSRVNADRYRCSLNTSSTSRKGNLEMEAVGTHRGFFSRLGWVGVLALTALAMMGTLLLTTGLMYVMQTIQAKGMESQLNVRRQELAVQKQLKELDMMSPSAAASPSNSARSEMAIRTFSCSTQEEMRNGFAKHDVQTISNTSTTYRASSGCAWIRIPSYVEKLNASGRYLFMEDLGGSRYFECGSFPGRANNSVGECKQYLNSHLNQDIFLVVKDGDVSIN